MGLLPHKNALGGGGGGGGAGVVGDLKTNLF